MSVSLQQTEKLLCGNHSFSQLGFAMMITRMKTLYARDPSQATVQNCMGEINSFLQKFAGIMGGDYAIISKI
jgi:hypothetical protein